MFDKNPSVPCALVSGHFNIIHADHIALLQYAAEFGEVVVGINGHEANVSKYGQHAQPLDARISVLQAIRWVSDVLVFNEATPVALIEALYPDYLVKGPDYLGIDIPEIPVCQRLGIEVRYRPGGRLYSSSSIAGCSRTGPV